MVVKTITIKKNVYDKLTRIKQESESFSDLFERLAEKEQPDLARFAGILNDEEAKEIKNDIQGHRKEFDADFENRAKNLGKTGRKK